MTHTQSVTQPRGELLRYWDELIGPGATPAEQALILGAALAAAAGALVYGAAQPQWTPVQLVVAALIALDIGGGIPANATVTAKRWYHRPGQTARHHLMFVAVHAFHLLLMLLFFRPGDWAYFAATYGGLMLGAALIVAAARDLQRPLAMTVYMALVAVGLCLLTPTPGLEWFLPAFYLKLLVSHLLDEAPPA